MVEQRSDAAAAPLVHRSDEKTGARDYRWVVGVWVMVALFALITAYWSEHVGIPLRDPEGRLFRVRLTSALVLFVILALVDANVRAIRAGWTPLRAVTTLRDRWPLSRLTLVVSGLLAYHIVYVCYRNLKSWDAFNTVRDDTLLSLERWIFFGNSPAVLLHDVFGQGAAAPVLDSIYRSFTYLVPLSVVSALAFTNRIRDGYVFLTSAMWLWILGVGSYYLIPSLGPFASAPEEFAGLRRTRITATQEKYLTERAHLLENPEAGDAFASISAFASLHTAFTCLILLGLRYYGLHLAARVMVVYLAAVMVSTIYFGWHFVVDDIAGIMIAFLCLLFAQLMIYPQRRVRWRPEAAPSD